MSEYSTMSLPELRPIAKEKGINMFQKSRADIIAALEGKENELRMRSVTVELIDCQKCTAVNSDTIGNLSGFLLNLPAEFNTQRIMMPEVEACRAPMAGVSGIVMTDTGHIAVRTSDEDKKAWVTVASCKPMDRKILNEFFDRYFLPGKVVVKAEG